MIVEKIKSLLKRSNKSKVKKVKKLTDNILSNDQTDFAKCSKQLTQCLDLMEEEVTRVRSQASEYSNYSIKKNVWLEGIALAKSAEALATFLSDKDLLAEQEKATQLWAQAALGVCSHQHHMVGPAMIATAVISERTGKLDHAQAIYGAVLEDFQCVLMEAEMDEFRPNVDSLTALQSLQSAAAQFVEFNDATATGVSSLAPDTLKRINAILERPI